LNYAFHCLSPEWVTETWSAFAIIFSTSAGSRTHARMYWPKKNKEYS